MWEPENILVVGQEWHTHYRERPEYDEYDRTTYCDIYECSECPRYGDDCDGNGEDEDDE